MERSTKHGAEARVMLAAYHDEITGLPNRFLLREHAAQMFRAARGDEKSVAILFLGVEPLGRITEAVGDDGASELLLQVAQRINQCFPDPGMVSRVAWDEFAACCLVEDRARVHDVADSIRREFAAPFRVGGRHYELTLSIGISVFPADGADAAAVLGNAESAMLVARRQGGNGTKFYAQKDRGSSPKTMALEADLPRALKNGELFLEYQPSLELASGRISGVEALLRWDHPQLGVIPPDLFIPLSDETGLIIEIGYWVLRQACEQTRWWHERGFQDLSVAVNFSAVQLGHVGLIERVQRTLLETGIDPAALEIEVTETVAMQDAENTIERLGVLKDMGVRIVLDDFGMGYSCLSYLKLFPIDSLKIDQTFVREVTRDRVCAALVRSIVGLGKTLGLRTVAEGVETGEQLEFLRAEGCDRVQGFLFSKPIPAAAVLRLLEQPQRRDDCCLAI
jgi:diguanylate cyclase (GGDEF)-like protein